jgi:alpha-galactosidase
MLYYMPQVWTSDDSDAIERLQIQYGTSLVYPTVTMGAHVSAIPNHQVGRQTPLETRGAVAMQGCFGYELDITRLSESDRQIMQAQIRHYKELRPLLQFGDLYRLIDPVSHGTDSAWMVVSPDRQEAWVTYVQVMARPNPAHRWLRLEGLSEDTEYRLTCWTGRDKSQHFPGVPESWQYTATESRIFGGDELMKAGLTLPVLMGDYQSISWHLQGAKQSAVQEEK